MLEQMNPGALAGAAEVRVVADGTPGTPDPIRNRAADKEGRSCAYCGGKPRLAFHVIEVIGALRPALAPEARLLCRISVSDKGIAR
jgi:hypothetical protein